MEKKLLTLLWARFVTGQSAGVPPSLSDAVILQTLHAEQLGQTHPDHQSL